MPLACTLDATNVAAAAILLLLMPLMLLLLVVLLPVTVIASPSDAATASAFIAAVTDIALQQLRWAVLTADWSARIVYTWTGTSADKSAPMIGLKAVLNRYSTGQPILYMSSGLHHLFTEVEIRWRTISHWMIGYRQPRDYPVRKTRLIMGFAILVSQMTEYKVLIKLYNLLFITSTVETYNRRLKNA